jgi:hypothetical protein
MIGKIRQSVGLRTLKFEKGDANVMPQPRDAADVLNRDFLETRGRILEVAAALDRLDRAPGRAGDPPDRRLAQLRQALEALLEPGPGRAETVQRLFSLEYDPGWQQTHGLRPGQSH